jgi:hypothetical protein
MQMFRMELPDSKISEPFDTNALMGYASTGVIRPLTPILDEASQKWQEAKDLPVFKGYWMVEPIPIRVERQDNNENPFPKALRGDHLVLAVAAALTFWLTTYINQQYTAKHFQQRTTAGQVNGEPAIQMASADGLYCVSLPSTWQQEADENPNLVFFVDNNEDMSISIRKLAAISCTSSQTQTLLANRVNFDIQNKGWDALSQPIKITAGNYSGWAELMHATNENEVATITAIQTPDGVYDVAVFRNQGSEQQQHTVYSILQTFRKVSVK